MVWPRVGDQRPGGGADCSSDSIEMGQLLTPSAGLQTDYSQRETSRWADDRVAR